MTTNPPTILVKLSDLRASLRVSGETLRQWRIKGKLPPPDIDLGGASVWWHPDTLAARGIRLQPAPAEANPQTPAAS